MHVPGLIYTATSSLLAAASVWLVWVWWIPVIQQTSQQSVDASMIRLGEIGFDEQRSRFQLSLWDLGFLFLLSVGFWFYLGILLTMLFAAIYLHARSLVLTHIIDRRERTLRSQSLALTAGLYGLTQSGLSLPHAIQQLAPQTPAPLGHQIRRIANNYRLGRPLHEAITEVRTQLRLDAFSLLVTSLTCALKQGTSLEHALIGVQEALEHRDQVERQLSAKTASARTTIVILAFSPLFFLLVFSLLAPDSMALLFSTNSGKFVLAMIIGFLYAGIAWSRSLLRIR